MAKEITESRTASLADQERIHLEQLEHQKGLADQAEAERDIFKTESEKRERALKNQVTNADLQVLELHNSVLELQDTIELSQARHKQEVESLQRRIESSEARNEDLAMMNHESTKPLLRQIDAMRAQHARSIEDLEHVEQSYM